jgi:hypothetical protein
MVQWWVVVNMMSGAKYGPKVGYGEHVKWCRVWSNGGLWWTWWVVQSVVQWLAMVNMVSGAEYGPRVGYGEHGDWCGVWSKCGCLLTWCMHFIKLGNYVTTSLATYLSFLYLWNICHSLHNLFSVGQNETKQNKFSLCIWTLGCIWKLCITIRMYWQMVNFGRM